MALQETLTGVKQRVAIAIQDDPTQFLEFDAALSETHTGNANVSDHPVENGVDMTDHIQRTPEELQIVGIVSDTPLLALASLRAEPSIVGGDPQNRSQDAYGFLKGIKDAAQLVQVTTTLRDYASLAITGMSVVRDKDKSKIVELSLVLREIIIATTEQVEAPEPAKKPRKKRTNQGKKAKPPAAPPVAEKSSSALIDGVRAGVKFFFGG